MNWTTEKPAQPGMHWNKGEKVYLQVLHVRAWRSELVAEINGDPFLISGFFKEAAEEGLGSIGDAPEGKNYSDFIGELWAGPIPEPADREWTKENPTQPGRYWNKGEKVKTQILNLLPWREGLITGIGDDPFLINVQLKDVADEILRYRSEYFGSIYGCPEGKNYSDFIGELWAGPIPEPE